MKSFFANPWRIYALRIRRLKAGDVIWVDPGETVGEEIQKIRPWVVVSRDSLLAGRAFLGVPLKSNTAFQSPFRILIPETQFILDPNYKGNRPFNTSIAVCDQVRFLDKQRVKEVYGSLSVQALSSVRLGLSFVLDL